MRARIIILVCVLLIQVAIAFLPKIPSIQAAISTSPEQRKLVEVTTLVVGLSLALIGLTHNLNGILEEQKWERIRSKIADSVNAPTIQKQRDDEFYDSFARGLKAAKNSVSICYFAPSPPSEDPDTSRQNYYNALNKLMTKQSGVNFRRIVRFTAANKPWIQKLSNEYRGKANLSLASIEEDESVEMPLAVSVQVIDDCKSWIVAIEAHNRVGDYRDIYVEDKAFADAMSKYFNRLWNRATIIVDCGRLKAEI